MTAADLHLVLEKEQEAVVCALSTYLGTHMLTTYPTSRSTASQEN